MTMQVDLIDDYSDLYSVDGYVVDVLLEEGIIRRCPKCSTDATPEYHFVGLIEAGYDEPVEINTQILGWALRLAGNLRKAQR